MFKNDYCDVWRCHNKATHFCGKCRMNLCDKHFKSHKSDNGPWDRPSPYRRGINDF